MTKKIINSVIDFIITLKNIILITILITTSMTSITLMSIILLTIIIFISILDKIDQIKVFQIKKEIIL